MIECENGLKKWLIWQMLMVMLGRSVYVLQDISEETSQEDPCLRGKVLQKRLVRSMLRCMNVDEANVVLRIVAGVAR